MTITETPVNLPNPTLTPAERAWDAIDYMRAHPDEVNMEIWGAVHPQDTTRTVGCFAHTVVKRAGYAFVDRGAHRYNVSTPGGTKPVSQVAAELLGLGEQPSCTCSMCQDDLFDARGTVEERAQMVQERFGPQPVGS